MKKLPTITLSDLLKKRLKLVGYLLVFGLGSYVSETYLKTSESLSLVFGAALNFVMWEVEQEIKKEGVTEIVKLAKNK